MNSILMIDTFLINNKYETIINNHKLIRDMESMIKVADKSI